MLRVDPSAVLRLVLAGCLGASLSACDDPSTDPCDSDPTGCEAAEDFQLDSDCSDEERMGELEVQWGARDAVWGPQGGMHLEVGAWVGNLNSGRERALVTFSSVVSEVDEDTGEVEEWTSSEHAVEIGSGIWNAEDDGMAVDGIVWFTWLEQEGPTKWRVEVRDACGRTGVHEDG